MAKQNWQAKGAAPPRPARASTKTAATSKRTRILPAATASVVFLALLTGLLWWLIQFLDPVTPIRLLLVTGFSNQPGLPVNASAGPDGRLLAAQPVLDATLAAPDPAIGEETAAAIRGIRHHKPRTLTLLPGRATTSMVYVKATGVVRTDDQGKTVPYLLHANGENTDTSNAPSTSLGELVQSFADSAADRKILVLDCESFEPASVTEGSSGDFVEAAIPYLKQLPPSETNGMYVLFSSSPGERAWPWPSRLESIFGDFLSRGLAGEADDADNKDERVSLRELITYLKDQVPEKALQLCHASQKPLLLEFGAPDADFSLTAVARTGFRRPISPVQQATRASVLAGLQRNWEHYHDLAATRAEAIILSPGRWRRIEEKLLLAESQFRGGRLTDAEITIRDVATEFASMSERHDRWHEMTDPTVLTALSVRSAFPGLTPATSEDAEPLADLIGDVLAERISMPDAVEALAVKAKERAAMLDSDQQLLLLMASSRGGSLPEMMTDTHAQLLMQRRAAEVTSVPGHFGTAAWIQPFLQAADRQRRLSEDDFFVRKAATVSTGEDPPVTAVLGVTYDDVADVNAKVSEAFVLRDQLLAELPWWIRYLDFRARGDQPTIAAAAAKIEVSSKQTSNDEISNDDDALTDDDADATSHLPVDLVDEAGELVESLAAQAATLSDLLLQDPTSMTLDEMTTVVDRIQQIASGALATHETLTRRLAEFSRDLDDERLWPPTGQRWRRIHEVLMLPFACHLTNVPPEDRSRESTALRLRLLEKTLVAASEASRLPDQQPPSADEREDASKTDRRARIQLTKARLMAIPLPTSPLPSLDGSPADWQVWFAETNRSLRETAAKPPETRDDAMRADLAFRLVSPDNYSANILSPTMSLCGRVYALHLVHQAARATEDFYATTSSSDEHYFQQVAARSSRAARDIHVSRAFLESVSNQDGGDSDDDEVRASQVVDDRDYAEAVRLLENRLAKSQVALRTIRLQSDPAAVLFRAVSMASMTLRLEGGEQLPSGRAAVHVLPDDRVKSQPSAPDSRTAEFLIVRPDEEQDASTPDDEAVKAWAFFRGHEFQSTVQDVVVDELAGRSYSYKQQNTGPAMLTVQPLQISERPLQLLFVLDCSLSMAFEDGRGAPRIRSVSRILQRFADYAAIGNIDAGIRLFGHRVPDIADPEAHTDTQNVLAIGTFARSRVDPILPLRPTGHSPIFNALLQGRSDFPESDTDVRRAIILVSDGADNWAQAGESPGIKELREAYADGTIRIHTIGYNVDEFADRAQLEAIAQAGNGKFVAVSDAEELLDEVIGLAGLPGYRLLQNKEVILERERLEPGAKPEPIPAGSYILEIYGAGSDVITKLALQVLPGEQHRLVYDSGALRYENDPRRTALAVAGGGKRPELFVLSAQRQDEDLNLEFGLMRSSEDRKPLLPISAAISTSGQTPETWQVVNVPPNSASRHFPSWNLRIEGWPDDAEAVRIQVGWNQGVDRSIPVNPEWNSPQRETVVADGIRLVRQVRELGGDEAPRMTLTFVFDEFGSTVRSWSVVPRTPVRSLRHIYQPDVGVYSVQFSMKDGSVPNVVDFVKMYDDPASDVLEADVSLGIQRINK